MYNWLAPPQPVELLIPANVTLLIISQLQPAVSVGTQYPVANPLVPPTTFTCN